MSTDVQRTEIDMSGRVAEEIRALLARRRMTGRELARRLGVSPSWVSYRLTGTQPIDLNDLAMIAGVFGVKASDILRHAERGDAPYGDVALDVPSTLPALAVTGTYAHPAHPIVAAAIPLPRTPNDVRRTAPTGR